MKNFQKKGDNDERKNSLINSSFSRALKGSLQKRVNREQTDMNFDSDEETQRTKGTTKDQCELFKPSL